MFYAYNWLGGIIVSIVVKHTGSIVKGFATSGSIILSCILSSYFLQDIKMNIQFLFGTLLVILSTFGYSYFSVGQKNKTFEIKKIE